MIELPCPKCDSTQEIEYNISESRQKELEVQVYGYIYTVYAKCLECGHEYDYEIAEKEYIYREPLIPFDGFSCMVCKQETDHINTIKVE